MFSTRRAKGVMTEPELRVLRCTNCGTRWLSPAGALLVETDERCLHCGGSLVFDDRDENIDELRTHGDRVPTLGGLVQKGREGAIYAFAWVSRVRRGKIVSFKGCLDPSDALRDLQPEAAD